MINLYEIMFITLLSKIDVLAKIYVILKSKNIIN